MHFYPLVGFLVPTVVIGYGVVIPGTCVAGMTVLNLGFAHTVLGACVTYAVHVLYFWEDPEPHVREVRRVLRADGRFVLCFRSDAAPGRELPSSIYHFPGAEAVGRSLQRSGFREVRRVTRESSKRTLTRLPP